MRFMAYGVPAVRRRFRSGVQTKHTVAPSRHGRRPSIVPALRPDRVRARPGRRLGSTLRFAATRRARRPGNPPSARDPGHLAGLGPLAPRSAAASARAAAPASCCRKAPTLHPSWAPKRSRKSDAGNRELDQEAPCASNTCTRTRGFQVVLTAPPRLWITAVCRSRRVVRSAARNKRCPQAGLVDEYSTDSRSAVVG